MPREKDPFWKYATLLKENNSKWRCNFCGQEHGGGATRIKAHLAGIGGFGIKGCERVNVDVKAEAREAMAKKVTDSSDRGVSEERIPVNARAAPTSTTNPPNVEGGSNLQFPQDNEQEMRAADIANPPLDGVTSYHRAPPVPNSPFTVEDFTFVESLDAKTSNAQQNPGASLLSLNCQLFDNTFQNELQGPLLPGPIASDTQLSNMATTKTSQHSSQTLQSDGQCGYGIGLEPPIPSLPSTGPLFVESVATLQIPEDITDTIGPWTSEGEGTSCSMMDLAEEVWSPFNLLWQPQCSIQSQIPMNFQQIPAGVSSFQYNQLPATGNSHCLQGCNQHSQLQTSMDIDASIASRHTSDVEATIDDSQVPKAATNTTGPSSSQDMNRCSPTMNLRGIYAKDEMIRNLKRKVEELDDKEAVIKEQMEIESAASSVRKKPRILVERWLEQTEKARNNFQIIGQANAETLPPKQQVETLTREVEELIGKTLPQPLLIEERDAKGVKLLERKFTGKVIHRNIKLIWDHLTKNHGCKLGIYGMGGVGKTTIMMHIHNRLLEDANFDDVVFITVSNDFSIYKLQSDIGKALKCGIMEDEDEKKRAAMLSENLKKEEELCIDS